MVMVDVYIKIESKTETSLIKLAGIIRTWRQSHAEASASGLVTEAEPMITGYCNNLGWRASGTEKAPMERKPVEVEGSSSSTTCRRRGEKRERDTESKIERHRART